MTTEGLTSPNERPPGDGPLQSSSGSRKDASHSLESSGSKKSGGPVLLRNARAQHTVCYLGEAAAEAVKPYQGCGHDERHAMIIVLLGKIHGPKAYAFLTHRASTVASMLLAILAQMMFLPMLEPNRRIVPESLYYLGLFGLPTAFIRFSLLDTRVVLRQLEYFDTWFLLGSVVMLVYSLLLMVPWNVYGLILALAYSLTLLPAILCDAQLVSNFRNVIIAVAAVLDSAFLIQAIYKRRLMSGTVYDRSMFWNLTETGDSLVNRAFTLILFLLRYIFAQLVKSDSFVVIKKPLPKSNVVRFPPVTCRRCKSSVTPFWDANDGFGEVSKSGGMGEDSSNNTRTPRVTTSALARGVTIDMAATSRSVVEWSVDTLISGAGEKKPEDQSDAVLADRAGLSDGAAGNLPSLQLKKNVSFSSDVAPISPRDMSSSKVRVLPGAEDHLVITLLCRSLGYGQFIIDFLMDKSVWLLFCGTSMIGSMLGLLSVIGVLPEFYRHFMYANVPEFVLRVCLTDTRVALRLMQTFEWHFLLFNFILVPYAGVHMLPWPSALTFNTLMALNCLAPLFIDASIMTSRHNGFTTLYLIAIMAVYGYYVWAEAFDGALYDIPLFWGFTTAKKMVMNRTITSILFFGKHLWASFCDRGSFVMLRYSKNKKDAAKFPSSFRWHTVWSLQETLEMNTDILPAIEEDEERPQQTVVNPVAAADSCPPIDVEQGGSTKGYGGAPRSTYRDGSTSGSRAGYMQPTRSVSRPPASSG